MKIGILGGTFNPIHLGHLVVAQDAWEALNLKRVVFIPSALPPHKKPEELAEPLHRLRMIEAAIEGDKRFEVLDIEIRRGGPSYSVETLRALRKQRPSVEWYFIIGADNFYDLHLWREIDVMARLCRFVVVSRPGFDQRKIDEARNYFCPATFQRVSRHILTTHLVDISSTEIRARVRKKRSIRFLVPAAVESYIQRHSLYR